MWSNLLVYLVRQLSFFEQLSVSSKSQETWCKKHDQLETLASVVAEQLGTFRTVY